MKKFAAFLLFALIASPALADDQYAKSVIVTNGIAEMEVAPDFVTISASLNSRDKDLTKAKKLNDDNYAKILKDLTGKFGMKKSDIKGNSLSINPVYKNCYDEKGNYKQCDQTIIDYYDVNRSLNIKLTDLTKYDAVLSGLAESGYASVNSGQFGVTEITPHKDKVRDLAIESAKLKAEKIATKLGVKLKKPVRYEGYEDNVVYPMAQMRGKGGASNAYAEAAMPVTDTETLGSIKLNSNVTITYEIE